MVEPADDEVEPVGELVVPREAARSPALSHAVTNAVPRATEMASAIGVILMRPPWLGYEDRGSKERAYLPSVLKSLCCALSFGSTWPCTGVRSVLPLFA